MNILSLFDGISGGQQALQRAGISDTQKYKSLGTGWTIEVIAHILKYMEL